MTMEGGDGREGGKAWSWRRREGKERREGEDMVMTCPYLCTLLVLMTYKLLCQSDCQFDDNKEANYLFFLVFQVRACWLCDIY